MIIAILLKIMPNYCDYTMKVAGKQSDIEKLVEILNRDYNYAPGEPKPLPHLWRVFEANYDGEQIISGYCAWSVYSCMFDVPGSYQYDHKDDPKYNGTDIVTLSKELHLKIEIFSEEPGMCFQEHYLIDNGKLLVDETHDYQCEETENGEWECVEGFPNYLEFSF